MSNRWVRASLVAGMLGAASMIASAQQFPPAVDQPAPAPAAKAKKKRTPPPAAAERPPVVNLPVDPDPTDAPGQAPPAQAAPVRPAAPPRAIACAGAFAKNSSHLKLATVYGSQNLDFAEVDGPDNTRLMASVLFPKDPKRRLEVLWSNEAARSDTSLIVIGGQSTWTAPKGLRVGLPVEALEKLNGRPFKLRGFAPEGAAVADWLGGGLDKLPGGCKIGIRLAADPKAPDDARAEAADAKELLSSDAVVRKVKPKIAEIIIGY